MTYLELGTNSIPGTMNTLMELSSTTAATIGLGRYLSR